MHINLIIDSVFRWALPYSVCAPSVKSLRQYKDSLVVYEFKNIFNIATLEWGTVMSFIEPEEQLERKKGSDQTCGIISHNRKKIIKHRRLGTQGPSGQSVHLLSRASIKESSK